MSESRWHRLTAWPADVIRQHGAIECRCADGSRFVTAPLDEVQGLGGPAVADRPLTARTIADAARIADLIRQATAGKPHAP